MLIYTAKSTAVKPLAVTKGFTSILICACTTQRGRDRLSVRPLKGNVCSGPGQQCLTGPVQPLVPNYAESVLDPEIELNNLARFEPRREDSEWVRTSSSSKRSCLLR